MAKAVPSAGTHSAFDRQLLYGAIAWRKVGQACRVVRRRPSSSATRRPAARSASQGTGPEGATRPSLSAASARAVCARAGGLPSSLRGRRDRTRARASRSSPFQHRGFAGDGRRLPVCLSYRFGVGVACGWGVAVGWGCGVTCGWGAAPAAGGAPDGAPAAPGVGVGEGVAGGP